LGFMDELIRNLLRLQTLEFDEAQADNAEELITELRGKIPHKSSHITIACACEQEGPDGSAQQVCTGCHMRLPLAVIMTLRHGRISSVRQLRAIPLSAGRGGECAGGCAAETKPARTPRRRKKSSARLKAEARGLRIGALPAPVSPE